MELLVRREVLTAVYLSRNKFVHLVNCIVEPTHLIKNWEHNGMGMILVMRAQITKIK